MAPMIRKEDGVIDFNKSAVELERRFRAFTPWPGATTQFEGKGFKVHRASVARGRARRAPCWRAGPEGIVVACGENALRFEQVQPEGKRVMSAKDFLLGRKLEIGSAPFQ